MRHAIFCAALGALLLAAQSPAAPSSKVAWTVETMNLVASGNAEKGKQLAQSCAGCHGPLGVSASPPNPSIAGLDAAYSYKQLRDYKDNTRSNPLMSSMVASLGDQDMADIAAYYAAQPAPTPSGSPDPAAEILVSEGDGTRLIPACSACHGRHGEGNARSKGMPALAAQQGQYLEQTLRAYRDGSRANDVYRVMRAIARELSDEEIGALARYYAAQSGR